MFENRVPKRGELSGEWGRLHNEELMIRTAHKILFGWSNQDNWDAWGKWNVWGRGDVHRGL